MALWQLMHMMYDYLNVWIPPWLLILLGNETVIKSGSTLNERAAFLQKTLISHSCSKHSEYECENGSRKFDIKLGMHKLQYLKMKNARYILQ